MVPHPSPRTRRPLPRRRAPQRPAVEILEDRCLLSAPTSFTPVGIGGGGYFGAPVISPFNGNEFYMATDMGAAYHTTDGGQNWATLNPFQSQISGTFWHPIQFTSNPNVLYGANFNIYGLNWLPEKSSDGGVTWNTVTDPTGGSLSQMFGDLNNANNLVVTGNNSVYLSTNGGTSFSAVAGPAGSGAPLTLSLPADNNQLDVAGLYSASTTDTLYLATNAGLLIGTPGGGSYSWGFYSYGSGGSGLPAGTSIWSLAGATSGGTTRLYAVLWSDSAVGPSAYSNSGSSTYAGTYELTAGQGSWTALPGVPQESNASPDTPIFIGCAPNNPNVVYQGGSNAATAPTVWLSTNGGQSWTQTVQYAGNANVQTGTVGQQNDYPWGYGAMVTGLSVCPTNVNDVLISTWVGAYRTTDGGAQWTSVVQQNPQADGASAKGVPYISSINDTGNFYAAWSSSSNMVAGYSDLGIDVSNNGGNSWAVPSFPGNWALTPTNVTYGAQYDANNGTWYAAGGDHHDLFFGNTGDVSGGNGGVFYSTDQGKTWYFLRNFGATATSLALDPSDPTHNTMYVTLVDTDHGLGGVWVTRDLQDGTNAVWYHLNQPTVAWGPAAGQSANHHPYNIHVLNNGQLVVSYAREDAEMYQAGVFTGTVHWSGGVPSASWTDVTWNDGKSTVDAMRTWSMDLTIDPTDPTQQTWYAGSFIDGRYSVDFFEAKGLWKTTNGGKTWSLVWGNDANPSAPGWYGVYGGYVNPSTGELYFSTNGTGLYYSANSNAASPTFQQVNAFPFGTPTRVEFNPYNTSQVWVGSFGDGLWYGGGITAPTAPTGLSASAGDSAVSLTWGAVSGATSYNVYRGTSSGRESLIASGFTAASFTDTGLTDGTTYYYEVTAVNAGGESGRSSEVSTTPRAAAIVGTGTGLTGQYYSDMNLGNLVLTRTDPQVNFTWPSDTAAVPGQGADDWSVKWTGQVQAQYSEAYTFTTVSDDGVRLYVNGQLVINDWTDHPPTTDASAAITLVAGQKYIIEMDYYERAGGATAQLYWVSPSTPREIIPSSQLYPAAVVGNGTGLTGEYYSGTNLDTPVLARTDATVNFTWQNDTAPVSGLPNDYWSVKWTGWVQAPATGNYTFSTITDDGVRLWVNNQLVINDWNGHPPTENDSVPVPLVAGQKYLIEMDYFEGWGGATAQLEWSGPAIPKQVIPTSQLYPAALVPPPGGIVVHLAEDYYLGDAQYTIAVDGQQVGGVRTETALQNQGQSEAVILPGPYTAGVHTVSVTFLNDAYAGTPQTDRNLYVDGINFLGASYPGATLWSNGTQTFQIGQASVSGTSATFIGADPTTHGNWQAGYGSSGYVLSQGTQSLPAYASVSVSGASNYTWTDTSSDVRALQQPGTANRLAACWYTGNSAAGSSFTIDVNLTDGMTHQLALYALDWDGWNGPRSEQIDIIDPATGQVLNSQVVSGFGGGQYLDWRVSGHVQIRVTNLVAGSNAVISGVFLD